MIRIAISGATGRVGKALLRRIDAEPDLSIVEAISANGTDDTVPLKHAQLDQADVIVDFTSPAGTMALLSSLAGRPIPIVVGTTGFNAEQAKWLDAEATRRPILVGANFTLGFEDFTAAAIALARALPEAGLTVGETYNAMKKPVASGTTQRLCRELSGQDSREVKTDIQRIGDTPGINMVELEYGVASMRLELTVHSRAAYAAGALDAARWLIDRPNGFYQPKDMITDR